MAAGLECSEVAVAVVAVEELALLVGQAAERIQVASQSEQVQGHHQRDRHEEEEACTDQRRIHQRQQDEELGVPIGQELRKDQGHLEEEEGKSEEGRSTGGMTQRRRRQEWSCQPKCII